MTCFAHSGTRADKSDWQTMRDHATGVADRAGLSARPFGLERAARLLGMFHDLGKYDPRFQPRLEGAAVQVTHSTAGAVILKELVRDAMEDGSATPGDDFMAEILCYCILGHHAGLPDKHNEQANCFKRRIESHDGALDSAWKTELAYEIAGLMPERITQALSARGPHARFDISVMARFLFSCLVDSDFKDTEAHYATLEGRKPDRDWTALSELLPGFIERFDAHMAGLSAEGDLNRLRGEIHAHIRAKASMEPGLFTLTVPTGGGKTLASLAFALGHALKHGHRRIIYAIPFTSIVDQTADVFRNVLGDEHILEHHASIDMDETRLAGALRRTPVSRDRLKLAMEDWAAPLVVTTNVQLFESLFAARTSRARKLHNIAGAIIILDEAQTIPRHLLKPCVRMLDALAHHFGCTIVLCTATQPALGAPDFPDGLRLEGRELAPDPPGLAGKLRRARIERVGAMDNAALLEAVAGQSQALVIVNSRRHALDLYREAQEAGLGGLVHLTTRQCAAHRREILGEVRRRLKEGEPCRVIATSLIEAGVDVDFPRVWRAEAGWDQVMQAAGRCNREGLRPVEDSIVSVFSAPDYPPPQEIAALVKDTARALDNFSGDIQSLDAIRSFFEEVYWRVGDRLDGREKKNAILPRLDVTADGSNFAFRAIAEDFRMIDSTLEPVIVMLDEKARKAVCELSVEKISSGVIARKLQNYIVQVPPKAREILIDNGHAAFEQPDLRGDQFTVLKNMQLYTQETGLLWENADYLAVENTIL